MPVLLQQPVRRRLAGFRVAHHHRHDVGLGVEHRQAGAGQDRLGAGHLALLPLPLARGRLEVADRGGGRGRDRRGQRGGEDEAGRRSCAPRP